MATKSWYLSKWNAQKSLLANWSLFQSDKNDIILSQNLFANWSIFQSDKSDIIISHYHAKCNRIFDSIIFLEESFVVFWGKLFSERKIGERKKNGKTYKLFAEYLRSTNNESGTHPDYKLKEDSTFRPILWSMRV